jgi:hypothetical protein
MSVKTRGLTITVEQELVTEECSQCGILFAMTTDFQRKMRQHPGTGFYCPAGHCLQYTGKSDAQKLREQLEEERRQRQRAEQRVAEWADDAREAREQAEHERRRANGYKGRAARISKRAKAGVCPCCNRHFVALERHMATKHPTFTPEVSDPPFKVIEGGKAVA